VSMDFGEEHRFEACYATVASRTRPRSVLKAWLIQYRLLQRAQAFTFAWWHNAHVTWRERIVTVVSSEA